ncbi:MAG: STAS/SEC14 domain-containing protein [Chitinophagales bacterium]
MKIPTDKDTFETELGTYWFDEEGILNSVSSPAKRTLENTRYNFDLVQKLSEGSKPCLLVQLCKSPIPSRETQAYVKQRLPDTYTAMAMLSDSGVGELIMNILFKLQKPPIPMKTFKDEEKARAWLSGFAK